jgi:hypothetical protein
MAAQPVAAATVRIKLFFIAILQGKTFRVGSDGCNLRRSG